MVGDISRRGGKQSVYLPLHSLLIFPSSRYGELNPFKFVKRVPITSEYVVSFTERNSLPEKLTFSQYEPQIAS